jgi:taurine dioxygenase
MSAATATPSAATVAPQSFEIRPFSGAVGAEIIGLDLTRPINDQDFSRIHRAHLDHHVVVFRDQQITPQQQIDFSRRFGVLQIHVLKQFLLANHPEILIVSNIVENGQNGRPGRCRQVLALRSFL